MTREKMSVQVPYRQHLVLNIFDQWLIEFRDVEQWIQKCPCTNQSLRRGSY
jgi:hypothetical protein